MTTTGLTLDLLRRSGYRAASVERWLPEVNRHADLWGFGDVIAVADHREPRFLIVQCTSIDHVAARLAKAKGRPELRTWLNAGGGFQVWGWHRRFGRWEAKRVGVNADDLADVLLDAPPRRHRRKEQREMFA